MKNLVLLSQLAISLVSPIFLGLFIGIWIDNHFGLGHIFTLILMLLGVISGFINSYKLISSLNRNKKSK